ncbi:hypothetical protein LCGC14_2973020, partial [marine sediment metagenome]
PECSAKKKQEYEDRGLPENQENVPFPKPGEYETAKRQVGELRKLIPQDLKPEVVRPGEVGTKVEKSKLVPNGKPTKDPVGLAVDIFVALRAEKEWAENIPKTMEHATDLVKQAQKELS